MALLQTVVGRQAQRMLAQGVFQRQVRLVPGAKWVTTTSCMKADVLKQGEDFWDKNKRLNRPTSPHLTIYKPQITSMLSITHRGAGLAMSGIMSGFAIGMLALPGSYPHYMQLIESMHYGGACIFMAKLVLAWPFMFHFANGLRHLAWDLGKGFGIKEVYASGWTVLGISSALAIIAAAM